jgi:hypothetical protein
MAWQIGPFNGAWLQGAGKHVAGWGSSLLPVAVPQAKALNAFKVNWVWHAALEHCGCSSFACWRSQTFLNSIQGGNDFC